VRLWPLGIALAAAGGATACASDTLLGELSLLTDGRVAWNKARVAGGPLRLALVPSLPIHPTRSSCSFHLRDVRLILSQHEVLKRFQG